MRSTRFLFLFIILSQIIASCHKTDQPPVQPFIVARQTLFNEMPSAGKDSLILSSNIELKLNALPSYLTAKILSSGAQQYKVLFSFAANNDTTTRACSITISGTKDSVQPLVIKFTQGGARPFLLTDKTSFVENPAAQADSLVLSANVRWHLSQPNDVKWIAPDRASGSTGTNKIMFRIDTNKVYAPRTADITISNPDGLVPALTLHFSQDINFYINRITPLSGVAGSIVTLYGVFGSNPVVKINGATSTILSRSNAQITCIVPSNAGTGSISVSFGNVVLVSDQIFTFYDYHIDGFLPLSGQAGTNVTINGSFGPDLQLSLNGQQIAVKEYTPSQINFVIPASAHSGYLAVTSKGQTIFARIQLIVAEHNSWVKISTGHGGFYQDGISFIEGNVIYNGLGYSLPDKSSINNDFKIFNTLTNLWQPGPTIPAAMVATANASCFQLGNQAFIGFGINNGKEYANWWSYTPSNRGDASFAKLTPFATSGSSGIAFVYNNQGYAGVPFSDGGQVDSFDPFANDREGSWAPFASLEPVSGSVSFVIDNQLYFSGANSGTAMYSLNLDDKTIFFLHPSPAPFQNLSSFTLNGFGYVITSTGKTYQYSPSTDRWLLINAQSPQTGGLYNAQVVNGTAYAWSADGSMYEFCALSR